MRQVARSLWERRAGSGAVLFAPLFLVPLLASAGCHNTLPTEASPGPAPGLKAAGEAGTVEEPAREPDAIAHFTRFDPAAARAAMKSWTPPQHLSPVASGPGIVICEPVTAGDAVAALGAGCARWLQFTVGGQGELGKTPLWTSVDRARHELGRRDLRLATDEAARLHDLTGVTHVAVGEITGSAAQCTLRYRLLKLPERKDVGAPFSVSGSEEQVVAGLPAVARGIATRLGVTTPRVPAAVGTTPAEMALLGRAGWLMDDRLTAAERTQLSAMTRRVPLAAMAALRTSLADDDRRRAAIARELIAQAPENPIAFAEIGWSSAAALVPHVAALARAAGRFPANYLFATAESWLRRSLADPAGQRRAAERATRCAPANPDPWVALGATCDDTADSVRKGRYHGEMSPSEMQFVHSLYEEWIADNDRAVRLDPLDERAWLHLSQAAGFGGGRRTAEAAFQKALALCPVDPHVFDWGLQLYQPKWFANPAALTHLADLATTTRFARVSDALDVADNLQQTELSDRAPLVIRRALREAREVVRQTPGSAQAHEDLAKARRGAGDLTGATAEYQAMVRLRPDSAAAHFALGSVLDDRKMTREAMGEYRATVRLDPHDAPAYYELAYALKRLGQLDDSERAFRQSLRIQPDYAQAHYGLAELYTMRHQLPAAIQEYRKAVAARSDFMEALKRLCSVLADVKQYDAAIEAGERAIEIAPNDEEAHGALGYALLMAHHRQDAAREFRAAVGINPSDPIAHEDLGDTLSELGKNAEARQEWQTVLGLDHGAVAAEARQMLAKHRAD